jgi:hypothetical protein
MQSPPPERKPEGMEKTNKAVPPFHGNPFRQQLQPFQRKIQQNVNKCFMVEKQGMKIQRT